MTGRVLWFTGLSGAGKSTICALAGAQLRARGAPCFRLDGDAVRAGLSQDLGFTLADRTENVRRIAEIARLAADDDLFVLVSCISPLHADRQSAKAVIGPDRFHEIYVHASVEAVRARDPKGLYRRFDEGLARHVSGVDSPYEAPSKPDLLLDTMTGSAEELARKVVTFLDRSIPS